jgi:hypothetical protein
VVAEKWRGRGRGRTTRWAGFAIERGQVAPPPDFYAQIDPRTGEPVGFATPTGKLELYRVIASQHGVDTLPNYREPVQSPYSTPELAEKYPLVLTRTGRGRCPLVDFSMPVTS